MSIDAQALLGRLAELLTDEGLDFWTKAYQAKSINEAVRAIIRLKPDANYKRVAFTCVAATALQPLPIEVVKLLDVEGVLDAGGQITCSIKANSINELNRQERNWRQASATDKLEFFIYEDTKPREFWLYPRPVSGLKVSLVYSFFPELITKDSEVLAFSPQFENDIINYCLWRAWLREGTEQKIISARQIFHEELGLITQVDDATHPRDNRAKDERNQFRAR